jgi:ABC-type antimicrobial peptide transport system permease subunit
MTETLFSINDLLRRRSQTALVTVGTALCVASTLFLLLLGSKIGFGILSVGETKLSASFSAVFSRFVLFAELLVFVVGIVIISFLIHAMMAQRMKDIGLMKAAGCPNDLIFGYFMNELIMVSFAGCLLGIVLGVIADYLSSSVLTAGLQAVQWRFDPILTIFTFVSFIALSLIVGTRPILAATKVQPATALSPTFSTGLSFESDFKGSSKAGLAMKIAIRSLFRRRSASFRVVLCLTVVFILVTVSVAGGIIANETTTSWVEKAVGQNTVMIAHPEMSSQYKSLLSGFYGNGTSQEFNYSDKRYLIPEQFLSQLKSIPQLRIDPRLVLEAQVSEVPGIVLGQNTAETYTVGDSRRGTSLIVGIEPNETISQWFLTGSSLNETQASDAMVGDTIGLRMFSQPLIQKITLFNREFKIAGVCVDPLNNGNVTYVPLSELQTIAGISQPNVIMVKIDGTTEERKEILDQINTDIKTTKLELEVSELDEILDKQLGFVRYVWSTITLLPLLSLSAAALSLVGYVALTISEQRQELVILRAVGARPRTVMKIVVLENLLVLLSSWAAGIALGIIVTLLILIPEPIVTGGTIIEISAWLSLALVAILASSLYPALSLAKKPILEVAGHH